MQAPKSMLPVRRLRSSKQCFRCWSDIYRHRAASLSRDHMKKNIKHISILSVLLLTTVAIEGCSKDPDVSKREYLRSGDAYVAEKKFNEAIIEYRNAVQQDPTFGEARLKLAESYQEVGNVAGAYAEYIRAADLL